MTVAADFRLGTKPAAAVTDEVIPGSDLGRALLGRRGGAGRRSMLQPGPGEWLWLHFSLADMRTAKWLETSSPLIPEGRRSSACLSKDDTQQIVPISPTCVAGVFFDLLHDFDQTIDDFGHFHFALTERVLITGRRHALTSIEAIRQRIETGHRYSSPVDLLTAIVEQIAATIDLIIEELAAEIDLIEDTILKEGVRDDRVRLGTARLTSVRIHRRLNGLRGVFRRL